MKTLEIITSTLLGFSVSLVGTTIYVAEDYVEPDPEPIPVSETHYVSHEEAVEMLEEHEEEAKPDYHSTSTIKDLVETEFGEDSVMVKVAECESKFRQFEEGEPLWNEQGSSAVGVFQIMDSIHGEDANELGLDIVNDPIDNVAYAIVLYNENGTKDWNASADCWGN